MFRNVLFAFVMLVMCVAFVTADTIKGKVTKMDDKGLTISNKDNKDGKALEFAKTWKLYTQKKGEDKVELTGEAKDKRVKALQEKGGGATVETNKDGKVTEIILFSKK